MRQSAFSVFSASLPKPLRFNHYRILGPDVMHEIEVGSWKAILMHLLRILLLLRHITRFNRWYAVSHIVYSLRG